MSDKIAYYYDADKNTAGAFIPGVPLADLTEAQVEGLAPHEQATVKAAEFYRKTKPEGWKAHEPPVSDEPTNTSVGEGEVTDA